MLSDDESVEITQNCSSCGHEHREKNQYLTVCVPEKYLTKRLLDNLLSTEIEYLYDTIYYCKSCSREVKATTTFGNHIFFNLINLNNTIEGQFTDTRMRLNHIPKQIKTLESLYYLRGTVTTPNSQQDVTSHTILGHYHAHTYRHPINTWQLYDDNKDKMNTLNEKTLVNVQLIMYSK